MKIELFMWLVLQRKILTWDNIRKRGMWGPSRFQLCEAQEETIEHLLNSCIFTSKLWDFFATIFNHLTETKKVSLIPSTIRGIIFQIMKFLTLPRLFFKASLFGMCGKKETKESSKKRRILICACWSRY